MVAGDNKVLVPTLGSVEGLSSYANSAPEGATAFYTNDLYSTALEFTLAEPTTLSIGYECTHDEAYSWFAVGSMKLERNVTPATKFFDQYAAYEMLQGECMSMYALTGVMNSWLSVQESAMVIKGALENGEKVLRTKVEALSLIHI